MNTTKYMQTDSRWSELGYPKKPCTIGNSGCGEVSVVNAIIEMAQYAKYTPATIQPYCKQYAAPNCDGTYWSGIPAMMKRYGLTEVKEHDTMPQLFKELTKGNRVAIYLMGSRRGGSKGVHWTSSGHFICSTGYQYKNGKNYLYVKDSYSNSKDRNGWLTYEENMKGDVLKVWSGKLTGKLTDGTVATAVKGTSKTPTTTTNTRKLTVDGIGGVATVKRMQQFLGCSSIDGIISGQNKSYAQLYPGLKSVQYGKGGSATIKALQRWLGLSNPDGIIGKNTTTAWQKKLTELGYYKSKITGIFGVKSMKAWQECLNNNGKKKGSSPTPKPTPDPKPTPSKTDLKVIDVSEFQDSINWAKAKADGVKGAIIRCGYRGYESGTLKTDSMFLNHIKGAYKAGIPVGIYMFTEAKTEKEGREEADYAIKLWQTAGVPLSFPIAVDTEPSGGSKDRCKNLTRAQRTNAIKGFCERIKAKGYEPMIYASTSWLNNKLDMSKLPYKVWCAQYYSKCEYKGSYIIWQYTSEGRVNGVKGNVDLNHCYIQPKEVHPPKEVKPVTKPMPTALFNDFVASDTKIGQATNDENGGVKGGKTGDQTGNEVAIANYVKNSSYANWKYVFRAKDGNARIKIADACVKACNNNCVGYDTKSPDRKSLFKEAQKLNWEIDKIKTNCETTCSELANVCIAAAGLKSYLGVNKNAYVDALRSKLASSTSEFSSITLNKNTLQPGDILISDSHVAIVVQSMLRPKEASKRATDLQNYLNWYTDGKFFKECGSADGIYGNNTLNYVKQFQEKEMGKGQGDGIVGLKTIEAMKKVKK